MSIVRVEENHGPAGGRNAGAAEVRAPLIAITDDDCLPTSGWLRNVRTAFAGGADVVQGAVHADPAGVDSMGPWRSEEHTSELQSLMRISYAVFCLKKKKINKTNN